MNLQKKINLKNMANDRPVTERLVEENLNWKLDNYLQKFKSEEIEWKLSLTLEKNKKDLFNGSLQLIIDGKRFRYKREDYKKLDDLINHLFDHFKEELANK
ncbi:MAG: hypothetical protein ACD_3C00120G0008 [uncultured bacterium (gcode 4)]|uniref:Uncharacterized protein n=1 Tax=uncultured bacterium (gcode 4) TaxID=1234023 RepID=K2F9Z9_9BACT|nr:MAG: hypothetical protein ACD_3C00120G0008 [uncultured bacterium (gcode 4)]